LTKFTRLKGLPYEEYVDQRYWSHRTRIGIKLKVLLIAKGLHPPWATGAATYARGILQSLLLIRDAEVSVISTSDSHREPNAVKEDEERWESFQQNSVAFLKLKADSQKELKSRIFNVLKKMEKLDVVHIVYEGLTPFELVSTMNNFQQTLVVKHIYGPAPGFARAAITKLVYELGFAFRSRKRVILSFPSHFSASTYGMESNKNVVYIPPAINTESSNEFSHDKEHDLRLIFERSKTKFGTENLEESNKIILYLGWLRQERFPYFQILRAFKKSLDSMVAQDSFLLIVGRQSEQFYGERETAKKIASLCKAMDLGKKVGIALLELSEAEKSSLISRSEALIYPFTTSYLNPPVVDPPLGVLEGMASRRKVLTTRVMSIPQVIEHGFNGLLLPNFDTAMITKSISEALLFGKEIGVNARQTVIEKFSVEKVASILMKVGQIDE
jgi:glycosyltransferase involved in cell wall biosynthesis